MIEQLLFVGDRTTKGLEGTIRDIFSEASGGEVVVVGDIESALCELEKSSFNGVVVSVDNVEAVVVATKVLNGFEVPVAMMGMDSDIVDKGLGDGLLDEGQMSFFVIEGRGVVEEIVEWLRDVQG